MNNGIPERIFVAVPTATAPWWRKVRDRLGWPIHASWLDGIVKRHGHLEVDDPGDVFGEVAAATAVVVERDRSGRAVLLAGYAAGLGIPLIGLGRERLPWVDDGRVLRRQAPLAEALRLAAPAAWAQATKSDVHGLTDVEIAMRQRRPANAA